MAGLGTTSAGKRLLLRCNLSPGDVVMLTAAVRDVHRAHPGRFITAVETTAGEIWENNPFISPIEPSAAEFTPIDMHYPLIHSSNQRPYHFIHGFVQYLEEILDLSIPVTDFRGDIYISDLEKSWMSQVAETGWDGPFWIIMAGGKYDFTTKWWNPAFYQAVVDHFRGKILFVQCGQSHHWHPALKGVLSLIGKTDVRQFIRLVYHSDGVLSPVTFAMHLAAAIETKPDQPRHRPCVVIAGGREPTHWEAYPNHQFISTTGMLPCCQDGGCWKSICQVAHGHVAESFATCDAPVQLSSDLRIPQCMQMISPADVVRRIEMYYEGGLLKVARHSPPDAILSN